MCFLAEKLLLEALSVDLHNKLLGETLCKRYQIFPPKNLVFIANVLVTALNSLYNHITFT